MGPNSCGSAQSLGLLVITLKYDLDSKTQSNLVPATLISAKYTYLVFKGWDLWTGWVRIPMIRVFTGLDPTGCTQERMQPCDQSTPTTFPHFHKNTPLSGKPSRVNYNLGLTLALAKDPARAANDYQRFMEAKHFEAICWRPGRIFPWPISRVNILPVAD